MTVVASNDRFIEIESGYYPLYLYQVPIHNPLISIPVGVTVEAMLNAGYAIVQPTEKPEAEVAEEGVPEKVGEEYFQTWTARDFTPEERAQDFMNKQMQSEGAVGSLFNGALDAGAEVSIAGVSGLQHFGLSESLRGDYAAMKARAQRSVTAGTTTALILRSKEGVSVRLAPAKMIELCEALEDSYYEIQLAYYDLLDLVALAETVEDLPVLPEVIAPSQRVIA